MATLSCSQLPSLQSQSRINLQRPHRILTASRKSRGFSFASYRPNGRRSLSNESCLLFAVSPSSLLWAQRGAISKYGRKIQGATPNIVFDCPTLPPYPLGADTRRWPLSIWLQRFDFWLVVGFEEHSTEAIRAPPFEIRTDSDRLHLALSSRQPTDRLGDPQISLSYSYFKHQTAVLLHQALSHLGTAGRRSLLDRFCSKPRISSVSPR